MSDKSLLCHTYEQKMTSWLNRNFKKFDLKREEEKEDKSSPDMQSP
mgnify:CR=1 FL=1